jgi:hypothetical protein
MKGVYNEYKRPGKKIKREDWHIEGCRSCIYRIKDTELEFDESKHPRDAKGSSTGGRFKSKAGAPSGLKEWFGNSKIVDKNGDPLVVYHGTDVEFDKFDPTKARKGWLGKGFYFTGDETEAAGFGKIVKPFYLKIENPFIVEADRVMPDGSIAWAGSVKEQLLKKFPEAKKVDWKNMSEFLKQKGYDGIMNGTNLIVAFYPEQITRVDDWR